MYLKKIIKALTGLFYMRKYLIFILVIILSFPVYSRSRRGSSEILEIHGIGEEDLRLSLLSEKFSLYDVCVLALNKNENIAIEYENSLQADYRRDQAIGAFLPRISLRGSKMFTDEGAGSQMSGISLYARQNIFTGLTEYAGLKAAGYEKKMRESFLLYSSGRLLLNAASDFYSVLQLEQSIKNRQEMLKLYGGISAELKRRARLGRTKRSEVLLTDSQIQKIDAEILSLKNDLNRVRLSLSNSSGIKTDAVLEDSIVLADPGRGLDDMLGSLNRRPEIIAAGYEVEMARQDLLEARGGHLPAAYLEGSYNLYSKNKNAGDYTASLGVELPIFNGGVIRARVRESESKLRQAELKLEGVKGEAVKDITDAWESWESSALQVKAYSDSLTMAERSYNAVMREYRLNLTGIIDVFNSLRELQNGRDEYQRKRLQHAVNRLRLGVATGEFEGERFRDLKVSYSPEK
jgi:outer membrane protein